MVVKTHGDLKKITGNKRTSLKRLIEGGAAMLITQKMNHHIEIEGTIMSIPLQIYRLRE